MITSRLIGANLFDESLLDSIFRALPAKQNKTNVDIIEDENAFTLIVDAPGYKSSDINVEIENGILEISGHRGLEDTEKVFIRKERTEESFSRAFNIGEKVNSEKIKATLVNGILKVEIEKIKPEIKSPTKIQVKIG